MLINNILSIQSSFGQVDMIKKDNIDGYVSWSPKCVLVTWIGTSRERRPKIFYYYYYTLNLFFDQTALHLIFYMYYNILRLR